MSRWSDNDRGHWETYELECDKCKFKLKNPMVCEKYIDRKPSGVLRGEEKCEEFEQARN